MSAGHSSIAQLSFGLNGDADNEANSFATISSFELFTPQGAPVRSGPYDLRLGTTDHNFRCLTCAQGKKLCAGHRGLLPLKAAVPQPVAIAEIRRWLRVICLSCGAIVVDESKFAHLPASRRLAEAAMAETEGKRCGRCSAVHPKIAKDPEDHFTYWLESPARNGGVERTKLRFDAIRTMFERVADADVVRLGRSLEVHPRILTVSKINFPPATIRPGVKGYGGGSGNSYHDSTNILQHMVKSNGALPDVLPQQDDGGALDRALQNLQQLNFDLTMGSSGTSVTQGNSGRRGLVVGSRPVKAFLRGMARKEGRLRLNGLGQRTFYISRSTISGNMRFPIDAVGVPLAFARTLQVCETVQAFNRERLMPFFLNGRRQYPGCTHVVRRATGEVHDVAGIRDFRLEIGDRLYRDVVNGDLAFFNRQPTLERSSIGVHRVIVIMDPSVHTFQFNVLACENYNADFDGDQMNLWVARNPAAVAEAGVMSPIANWFISTKTSGPVNGQVLDSTIGANELTRTGVVMDKYHAMALFASTGTEPPRFDRPTYTGREVVSLLLAEVPVNYSRVPTSYSDVYAPYVPFDPSETLTVIEEGRLKRGVLDKKSIGAKSGGGVFHLIAREYGSQRAFDMIFAMQQMALQFLVYRGFTVGKADLMPGAEAAEQLRAVFSSVLLESRTISDRLLRGEIVPPIDSTVHRFYERLQMAALKPPEGELLRWVLGGTRTDTNGFYRMIAVGAKGTNPNLLHVEAGIGPTIINGERITTQFTFGRTSPYFPRFAIDPEAYGFVLNSYLSGMLASEFMFQNENGRVDLVRKALATAGTGYFMRKGVMSNQSSVVDNHRRVSKDTKVVQFLYGEDGLDSRELEAFKFRGIEMSDAAIAAAASVADVGPGSAEDVAAAKSAVAAALAEIRADRDEFRRRFMRVESVNFGQIFSATMLMPVNVGRIVEGVMIAARNADLPPPPPNAAGLAARIARVRDLCARLPYTLVNAVQERRGGRVPAHKRAAAALMCTAVRFELAPAVLAKLSDEQLTYVIDAIRVRYSSSLIDYGTAVGILAAQSISEPLTQYMLDSHHRSVGGDTSKAGLVRISEIYSCRPVSEEQSSAMQLPLRDSALGADAYGAAQEIANSIEHVTLRRFTAAYDVLLEPHGALIYPPYLGDATWMAEFERSHPLVRPPGDLTNWCFRFRLDKAALVLKAVDLELIIGRLRRIHGGAYVVHTQEAVPEVVIRCWLRASLFKRGVATDEARATDLLTAVLDTPIRGIPGVVTARAKKVARHRTGADGALETVDQYTVETAGTNLYGALLHSAVDAACAISNSVGDTYKLYGIEAARAKIIAETCAFMYDGAPNLRHLQLYCDEMTRTGRVTSVERGGVAAREPSNVMLRMANGAPVGVITEAALNTTKSRVYGMATPQLLGSTPQIGTFYNSVVMDDDFIRANTRSVDNVLDEL